MLADANPIEPALVLADANPIRIPRKVRGDAKNTSFMDGH